MKKLLIEICKEAGYIDPPNKSGITIELLIDGSLSGSVIEYVMSATGCSKQTVTNNIKRSFPDRNPIHDRSIVLFLLSKRNLKRCNKCDTIKNIDEFYYNSSKTSGISDLCKECNKASRRECYAKDPQKEIHKNNVRKRNRDELQTPKWANLDIIAEFYRNRPEGYHVDHIEPLNGVNVSGLHVIENLQYLLAKDNLSKGNR